MKTIIKIKLIFLFLVSNAIIAQNQESTKNIFVRVYDLNGHKIEKGKVIFVNDTLLVLNKPKRVIKLNVNRIGKIKTRRSTGHDVLVGSAVGGITMAVAGAATSKEETKTGSNILFEDYEYTSGVSSAEGAASGAIIGAATGALVGLGISAFKKSKSYTIDGDLNKWKLFIENENLKR